MLASRMLELLKSTPSGTWNQDDFDEQVTVLEQIMAARPLGPAAADGGNISENASTAQRIVSGLTPSDQIAYVDAVQLLGAKRPQEAWERAKPLFDRYRESYEVQDLRCKIAMQLSVPWETTREECAPLMRLTGTWTAPRSGH